MLKEPGGLELEPRPPGKYHLPFQLPKEMPRQRLYHYIFSVPVLLSPQHNFSFHE